MPRGTKPGEPVGFMGAVRNFFRKYAQFSGRASRSEYWWATLALMLGFILVPFLGVILLLFTIEPSNPQGARFDA